MQVGSKEMVKYPFSTTYNGVYTIVAIEAETYFLQGIEGGFDISYLEVA